jgi:hypothetical protein
LIRRLLKNEKKPGVGKHRAKEEDCMKKNLGPDRIVPGVAISTPSRNQVNYPAQKAGRSDPGNTCENQPDNADQDTAVIDLSHSGY